ncbi:MAG: MmcQ/YjbR family DNA-binding protein, partial [Geodermatophilaceae bacterium]
MSSSATRVSIGQSPLERLRAVCLALSESTERLSHGESTWFIGDKKVLVTYANRHHDDRVGFWCAAPAGEQEAQG